MKKKLSPIFLAISSSVLLYGCGDDIHTTSGIEETQLKILPSEFIDLNGSSSFQDANGTKLTYSNGVISTRNEVVFPIQSTSLSILDFTSSTTGFYSTKHEDVISPITTLLNTSDDALSNLIQLSGLPEEVLTGDYESTEFSFEAKLISASLILSRRAGLYSTLTGLIDDKDFNFSGDWFDFLDSVQIAYHPQDFLGYAKHEIFERAIKELRKISSESHSKSDDYSVLKSIEDFLYITPYLDNVGDQAEYIYLNTGYNRSESLDLAISIFYRQVSRILDDADWAYTSPVKERIDSQRNMVSGTDIEYIYRNSSELHLIKDKIPGLTEGQIGSFILDYFANDYNNPDVVKHDLEFVLSNLSSAVSGVLTTFDSFFSSFPISFDYSIQHEELSLYFTTMSADDFYFEKLRAKVYELLEIKPTVNEVDLSISFYDMLESGKEYHPIFSEDGLKKGNTIGYFSIDDRSDELHYYFEIFGLQSNYVEVLDETEHPKYQFKIVLKEDLDYEAITKIDYEIKVTAKSTLNGDISGVAFYPHSLIVENVSETEITDLVLDSENQLLKVHVIGEFSDLFNFKLVGTPVSIDESESGDLTIDVSAIDISQALFVKNLTETLDGTNSLSYELSGSAVGEVYKSIDSLSHNGFEYGFMYDGSNIWLDRNLGATKSCEDGTVVSCGGFLVQWGRDVYDGHHKAIDVVSSQANSFQPNTENWYNASPWTSASITDQQNLILTGAVDYICPKYFTLPTRNEAYTLISNVDMYANLAYPTGLRTLDGVLTSTVWSGLWTNELSNDKPYRILFKADSSGSRQNVTADSGVGTSVRCIADFN